MIPLRKLRSEGPLAVMREAVWRTQKKWLGSRSDALLQSNSCPVHFQDRDYYSPLLKKINDDDRRAILTVADEICGGEFTFLGYPKTNLGLPPNWHTDFVTGAMWEKGPHRSMVRVRFDGTDVKVPWELSRLQFLPILGKAYVLTHSERYRQAAKDILTDWISENPVGFGVNWTLAMEVALRGMSICFLLDLLFPLRTNEQSWLEYVTLSLWHHLAFIEGNLEFSHFTRSNHYLSNIVGLFCLSAHLGGPGMSSRFDKYSRLVEREILLQVHDDGGDYESSTGYHLLVTQMFTSYALLKNACGTAPSQAFMARLRAMYRVMAGVADADACLPHVGDCDDGRVEWLSDDLRQMQLPVGRRHSLRISGQLGIGSALFGQEFGGCESDAAWYGLERRGESKLQLVSPSRNVVIFPKSGMANVRNRDAQLWFFNVPNGIGGKGSHTHNDKLSVVLKIGDTKLLCDSGTGVYTRNAALRNELRSTRAHNTVVVDGAEQNRYSLANNQLFRMDDDATPSTIKSYEDETGVTFQGSHSGYSRLGVWHTRSVSLFEGSAIIEDVFDGNGHKHNFEINYHLPNEWTATVVQKEDTHVGFEISGPRDVTLEVSAGTTLNGKCEPVEISRTYGSSIQAHRLSVTTKSALPCTVRTEIRWM